jgi:hypothetical protein
MRWVLSVEGLPVPARSAVLKCLHNRLGLSLLDGDRHGQVHPLRQLLARLQALAKLGDPAAGAMWSGSWVLDAPSRDPVWAALHRDLAHSLARKLLPPGSADATTHLMVFLDADADEAFETMLSPEACQNATREVSLQHLRDAKAKLDASNGADVSPFPHRIVRVPCPPFAGDNPSVLGALCTSAVTECLRVMAEA